MTNADAKPISGLLWRRRIALICAALAVLVLGAVLFIPVLIYLPLLLSPSFWDQPDALTFIFAALNLAGLFAAYTGVRAMVEVAHSGRHGVRALSTFALVSVVVLPIVAYGPAGPPSAVVGEVAVPILALMAAVFYRGYQRGIMRPARASSTKALP